MGSGLYTGKMPVFGLLKHGAKIYTKIIPVAYASTLQSNYAGSFNAGELQKTCTGYLSHPFVFCGDLIALHFVIKSGLPYL
jgi:hypothetical protein